MSRHEETVQGVLQLAAGIALVSGVWALFGWEGALIALGLWLSWGVR